MGFAFRDIPESKLRSGTTDIMFDPRLRCEIKREFAFHVCLRSQFLAGETSNIAKAGGEDSEPFFFYAGIRFAIQGSDRIIK